MKRHFVTFFSPGTFVAETRTLEVESWDVEAARGMASEVVERHGARPYAFQFSTRSRGPDDLDSSVTDKSGLYYLHGTVRTIDEVRADADPRERILLSNMECNGWDRIVQTTEGWRWTQPLLEGDVLLSEAP